MNTQFHQSDIDQEIQLDRAPGIEHDEIAPLTRRNEHATIQCMDYGPGMVSVQKIDSLDGFLIHHRPEWSAVRWISIAGLSDMDAIHTLVTKYDLHSIRWRRR
jgi:hypothetical protein